MEKHQWVTYVMNIIALGLLLAIGVYVFFYPEVDKRLVRALMVTYVGLIVVKIVINKKMGYRKACKKKALKDLE